MDANECVLTIVYHCIDGGDGRSPSSTLINRIKNEIKNVLNANELNLNIPKDMASDGNNDSLITSRFFT